MKPDPVLKAHKKRKILDLDESESDNIILDIKQLPKKDREMDILREQLRNSMLK
jgi:hypothetical protein